MMDFDSLISPSELKWGYLLDVVNKSQRSGLCAL